MKRLRLFTLVIIAVLMYQETFSTFSIVAVDPATGEIGSAGASCIDSETCQPCTQGVVLISDIIPGKGAVNSQASACIPNVNLQNAINWMKQGYTPDEIINLLQNNDQCGAYDYRYRQYGIVDFDDNGDPRSAGYSGSATTAYSSHILGENFAIQGNILLGSEVPEGIKEGFESETGGLACKLMAALQGGKVVGADTRCAQHGVSTLSSYIRVAQPDDVAPDFSLEIIVDKTADGVDPIDALQERFDQEVNCTPTSTTFSKPQNVFEMYPNPFSDAAIISVSTNLKGKLQASIFNIFGQNVRNETIEGHTAYIAREGLPAGIYFIQLSAGSEIIASKRVVIE